MRTRTLSGLRFGLNGLFLAAFLLRSLIPAGYMLDAPAGQRGIVVTLCGGHGPMTLFLPSDGKPSDASDKPAAHHHDAPCPFSVNSIFAFGGFAVPSFMLHLAVLLAMAALATFMLTPQRRFGNASSRSPPVFSSR